MKRFLLTSTMLAFGFGAVHAHNVSDLDQAELNQAIRDYLLANPGIIFEAVDIHNAQQEEIAAKAAKAQIAVNHDVLYNPEGAVIIGNSDGKTAIVEFVDYNCVYCRKAHAEIEKLIADDPELKVIARHLPILSEGSLQASQIVLATKLLHGNETALKLHNALYEFEGKIDKIVALKIANDMGLDSDEIDSKTQDQEVYGELAAMNELAKDLQIEGTPGFVIGEEILRGFAPAEAIQAFIKNIK